MKNSNLLSIKKKVTTWKLRVVSSLIEFSELQAQETASQVTPRELLQGGKWGGVRLDRSLQQRQVV